ncbi:mechanosensitive ion channel family protein [Bowmanella dokdonensis]|uniref:Small-conductance mechanosensitive channel n=1 Tax=Bowmanella dokdonensis TaxID=751969 RepID=A0A939DQ77_9ALTE|nr:mechanosensitive ion channel family protein [Bowmanella dokdonensis]MBN7826954.1 mechanosensitive ion channel family protein [Bowmanella dokdonensis]
MQWPHPFISSVDVTSGNALPALASEMTSLWGAVQAWLPMLLLGLLALTLLVLTSRPLARLLVRPLGYLGSSELVTLVVRRTIAILIILLGLYVFLRLAGLTEFALAILSGTGVMGLVLGFAFRDIAENFMASLLLSVQKPFKIGDVIEVDGQTGVVNQVTSRATTLVDYDGNHIQIPNATIYKNTIKNLTANPRIRGHFAIGIGYDAGIRKAQQLALELMNKHKAVLGDPEPQILVDSLGSATVNLVVYFWVNSETHSPLKVASVMMRLIMREFEHHGISMPDDARERIFPQGIPLVSERSSPATRTETSVPDKPLLEQEQETGSDDISSDTEDIRQQARQARDPEQGQNIL